LWYPVPHIRGYKVWDRNVTKSREFFYWVRKGRFGKTL
jgi:hypothetical protein